MIEVMKKHGLLRKIVVGIAGFFVVAIGVVLVPTPAPEGWLIVFGGIALLATEFTFAQKLLTKAKGVYASWQTWFQRQSKMVRAILGTLSALLTVALIGLIVWWAWGLFS